MGGQSFDNPEKGGKTDFQDVDTEAVSQSRLASTVTNLENDKQAVHHSEEEVHDVFKVNWDGPEDPEDPYNWSSARKGFIIFIIAIITLVTPLASSMAVPAIPQIMQEFHSDSESLAGFVISVFLLGLVGGPLLIAPLSELYGRTWIYHIFMALFVISTVACALATNLSMLIGFRFLAGLFGAAPIVLGGGTIADMYIQEERARAMSIWSLGPLIGPVIGPIAGGFVTHSIGWRWTFWILAIAGGVTTFAEILILRETYGPVLLDRKAKKLREATGDNRYVSAFDTGVSPKDLFKRAIVRPMKMMCLSPIVFLLSAYTAVGYGYLYLLFTTMTEVFQGQYHFATSIVGLAYIGLGVGLLLGVAFFSFFSDRAIKSAKAKHGTVKPETRLILLVPSVFFIPIGLLWYGWSAEAKTHWIVPIIGTSFVGVGQLALYMCINVYLIDAFTIFAASALAANTIMRSVMGAVLPLAGQPLYSALGLGWGNSLLAFIALGLAPAPLLFLKYGEYLRTSPRFQVQL